MMTHPLCPSISSRRLTIGLLAAAILCGAAGRAHAQVRVATYNTAGGNRTGMANILRAIGDESRSGISRPIDVISLQEQDLSLSVTQSIMTTLNGIYGPGVYARSTLAGSGDTTQSIVYNTRTVQLIGQARIGTTGTSGAPRQPMRFQLRPVGYTSSADFYVYSNHYKAGDSDAIRRNVEATTVRADADALGAGARIIYTGDLNIYSSNETMWATLTGVGSGGGGRAIDPINRPGNPSWSSAAYADVVTQSPVVNTGQNYPGQIGGGLDNRFDWQLVTAPIMSGRGFSYITGTYHAFGNPGNAYNTNLSTNGASPLLPYFSGYTLTQLNGLLHDLEMVSDHLPVVADYRIPAKMSVQVEGGVRVYARGYPAAIEAEVANTAPAAAAGADRLDYTAQLTGTLGTVQRTGSLQAGTPAAAVSFALDTSTVGLKSGTVTVSTTSPGVPAPTFTSDPIQTVVLEHALPSFTNQTVVTSTTLDFGTLQKDSGPRTEMLHIYNVPLAPQPFNAGLDLDQVSVSATPQHAFITTDLAPFENLQAGSGAAFTVTIDPAQAGTFRTVYTLSTSDHDVTGGISFSMVLDVRATVIDALPVQPGDFTGDGVVDGADLDYVLAHWGDTTGGNDLDEVLANWGQGGH